MQQAKSALPDVGGGTTLYLHKVESNQNHRSQGKKEKIKYQVLILIFF